ncbi:WD40 repeat-like protein [Dentipellis sp. KUC8613]|nr:WD40 repeat-like protein [Dentipellis sp. KUC8613]
MDCIERRSLRHGMDAAYHGRSILAAITRSSSIVVQPSQSRSFLSTFTRRRKVEAVDITGRNIFSALETVQGDQFVFEQQCQGFRISLELSLKRYSKDTKLNDEEVDGRIDDPSSSISPVENEEHVPEVLPENDFTQAVHLLAGLEPYILPGSMAQVSADAAGFAMRNTSKVVPLDERYGNFHNFGSSLCDFLSNLSTPKFTSKLSSDMITVDAIMHTIMDAAKYIQDMCGQDLDGRTDAEDNRRAGSRDAMLGEFLMRLSRLKRDIKEKKSGTYERVYPTAPSTISSNPDEGSNAAVDKNDDSDGLGIAGEETYLDKTLQPALGDAVAEELRCLPETRKSVLAAIYDWLDDDSEPNIFLLTGCPGTGKTAIASTLLTVVEHQQRMAACFLFKRYDYDPVQFWRTIAFNMASFHPVLSAAISDAVRKEPSIVESVESSFEKLVKAPLVLHEKRLAVRRPVIILDGIECLQKGRETEEYAAAWKAFLSTIVRWQELFPWAKLFVTTRPTQDVNTHFEAQNVRRIDLPSGRDVNGTETDDDVGTYVTYRLAEVKKRHESSLPSTPWPRADQVAKIKTHAAGMFTWAKVAMDFVEKGPDPDRLLTAVITSGTGLHLQPIDTLYEEIINDNLGYSVLPGFHTTVGSIALARSPLSSSDLHSLFPDQFKESSPDIICTKLVAMISCTGDDRRLQIRHQSFSDFLMDPKRCVGSLEPLLIDRSRSIRKLTYACLNVMLNELKFNICGIKSSHDANTDIPEVEVKEHIRSHLSYACRFWPEHLRDISRASTTDENDLLLLVQRVLRSRLLYWFEVLSFIDAFDDAPRLLLLVAEWLEGYDKENALLAADASRFAQMFRDPITKCASHIYITALPFCPSESMVSQLYKNQFPNLLNVWSTPKYLWASTRSVIRTSGVCYAVAVSADGKRIAVSLNEGDVQIRLSKTGSVLASLEGHTKSVETMVFSPNGKRLITGSDDSTIRVWDLESSAITSLILSGHSDYVRGVAISPDGTKIASACDDRTVRLWSAETGAALLSPFEGHTDWVRTVAFFPDGKKIISAGDDCTVRIWDADTGESLMERFLAHAGWVKSVAVSPDGTMAVTSATDGIIKRWDAETLTNLGESVEGHEGGADSVNFSPDSRLIVSGGTDGVVRLWDAATGSKFCSPLLGHTNLITHTLFSRDGQTIYSSSQDGTIRLWDRNNLPIWNKPSEVPDTFYSLALSSDGEAIVGLDRDRVWNWNINSPQTTATHIPLTKPTHGMRCAAICPSAYRAASAGKDNAVYIWDLRTGSLLQGPLEGHKAEITALAISSDGTRVVSGSDDTTVRIWNAETGQSLCGPLEGGSHAVSSVAISPDGTRLAAGDSNGHILISSMNDGELLGEPFEGMRSQVRAMSFSPDGKLLAIGTANEMISVWNIESGEFVHKDLQGHLGSLTCIAFSADGRRIVSGGENKDIYIWDTETGGIICGPLEGHVATITSVTFSKDGEQVISGSADAMIRVWDIRSKNHQSGYFKGHEDWVHAVGFSSDGTHIASGSDDKTVRVRDVTTGRDAYPPLEGHNDWVRSLSFSPDGKLLVTGSDDCTLRLWDARTGESLCGAITGHIDFVLSVAFAPDSLEVISGSEDRNVRVWKLSSDADGRLDGAHPTTAFTHRTGVNVVLYSPNGQYHASGAQDGMVHVTSETTLADGRCFEAHDGAVLSLAYSPDGRRLFSSSEDTSIRVWDVETGSALSSTMVGHTEPVYSIALCPDGRTLVSGSGDATVRLWNTDTGTQSCMPMRGHAHPVFAVATSPDGMHIASGSADCAVAVWDIPQSRDRVWPDNFRQRMHDVEFYTSDSAGLYASRSTTSDGWVCGTRDERLFWVPPMYRAGLWMPRTTGLLSAPEVVTDMQKFVHGTEWERSRESS